MKINQPMSLVSRVMILINFLLLIATSYVFGQPLPEFKTDAELYRAIKWSLPTNGVQAGILLIPDGSANSQQDYRITLALYGIATNRIIV
jgi:hypothetical protein